MDALKHRLNGDVVTVIFKFFIDGNDYDPFTLNDIKSLSKKITKWNRCAQWASKKGNLEILKYINSLKLSIDWVKCIFYASLFGHTESTRFILFTVLKGHIEMVDYYQCLYNAIEGGNLETIKVIEPEEKEIDKYTWSDCMCHAIVYNHLEIVKYFGERIVDFGIQYAERSCCMNEAEEGGDPHIIEYVENMFYW